MIPLVVFLLACVAVYLGTIDAAFTALMRLSLRLLAERSDRPDELGEYLDDPVRLFAPVRLLLAIVTAVETVLLARGICLYGPQSLAGVFVSVGVFITVFLVVLPRLLVNGDPERVLELLLPFFKPAARLLSPIADWTSRAVRPRKPAPSADGQPADAGDVTRAYLDSTEGEGLIEGEERRLIQSIVDFGDTLVREIMTPRPDIVAIRDDATIGDLLARFREQEYSRFPVYKDSLDNIVGFLFVKDLVALRQREDTMPIRPLVRPAVIVPENKRVPELLKQFQRQQTQVAIVVD